MKIRNSKVKIGARINYQVYFMFKYVCMTQGITMESRVEELLEKDMKATMKKTWFQDYLIELEKTEPSVFAMLVTIFNGGKATGGNEENSNEIED
ncbi:hypothetical protein [Acidovorax sp. SUPP3334]|uniref:hypothetical protein n=1 Tax=Acidovorax sp. SUPP3334 TaxID=2920881 RepID=UPI0023DE67F5|nr:hypothetical protein [Acidovorax sp. SUPP3334]GKT21919.1 hypothetical protein AVHM3334_06515 [Acidovorax sp. SUPP3334]